MDDSWQKLMGIDCGTEEGPSSPVFHKKKWVVLPTSLKRSDSSPPLTKCSDKKLKNKRKDYSNKSLQILDLNSSRPHEEKAYKNISVDEDDPLVIYNTTPTKTYKQKRKTIDLLSCSFRSEGSFCKKSKLDYKEHATLSKGPPGIKSENKNNELCSEAQIPTSVKVSSPQSNESRISQKNTSSKHQRNLLYSCNEKSNSCLKAQTLTVNDIFKSVIMIDEADIHSSPKKIRQTGFEVGSSDFQSVTSLASRNPKDYSKGANNNVSSPSSGALGNFDDSFRNCIFTEIENGYNKEVCSDSNYKKDPITANSSPTSPVNSNPMDETFNNHKFTEIEENYNWLNHKELKDNDLMSSSVKSAVIEAESLSPNCQNSVGKNISLLSDTKNDYSIGEFMCHVSEFSNQIVEPKLYRPVENENSNVLLKEKDLKSCDDEKNIFNRTLSPQKSIPKLESAVEQEPFLSTSKDSFDNLDVISTEEFRNNHLENHHHVLNESFKGDSFNQSIDNPEISFLNKSSGSKLDITLTDIMQRLLRKSESNPNMKKSLHKHISSNMNNSIDSFTQEITAEVETKNDGCIPEPHCLLGTSETVFLTQEYLETAKPEVSVDTSVIYYQQSFDHMISAEVKSRLTDNNCIVPPVEQELDESLLSNVCQVADRSADDSFFNINSKHTEKVTSNLNESLNVIENTVNSTLDTDYCNNDVEIKVSQYEHISHSPVVTSPKVFLDVEDHSNINKFPNQTSDKTGVSRVNSDFMSQGCLQQFNSSFQFELENLVSQKKENNLDKSAIEENNINVMNSHHSTSSTVVFKNIDISEECLSKDKSKCKDIFDRTALTSQNDNTVSDEEKKILENKNNSKSSVNIVEKKFGVSRRLLSSFNTPEANKKEANTDQTLKLSLLIPKKVNNFTFSSGGGEKIEVPENAIIKMKSICNESIESEPTKTKDTKDGQCINQEKEASSLRSSKAGNFMFSSASGKNINVSEDALIKVKKKLGEDFENSLFQVENTEAEIGAYHVSKTSTFGSFKNDNFMFSTAGGKNIKVSEVALAKIKSEFSNIMEDHDIGVIMDEADTDIDKAPKTRLPTSMIPSCDKALEESLFKIESKSNYILESHPITDKNTEDKKYKKIKNKTDDDLNPKKSLPKANQNIDFMFSNPDRKNIKVSEDALVQVKATKVKCTETKTNINEAYKSSKHISNKSERFMFSTAGGKHIKVSDVALAKVHSIFNEIMESQETEVMKDEAEKAPLPISVKNDNFMFLSASGKNIQVSEGALAKVKSKYSEILNSSLTEINTSEIRTDNCQVTKKNVFSSSKNDNYVSSSASGKNIQVSEDALAKVESKFSEILNSSLTEVNSGTETHNNQPPKHVLSSSNNDNYMFSSASGKNIQVSEDTLAKVKSKFSEILNSSLTEVNNAEIETHDNQPPKHVLSSSRNENYMFSSASGKNIQVSEDALAKVKSKFSEILNSSLTEVNNAEIETHDNQPPKHVLSSSRNENYMFSSASGKNIQVSEDALAKVKSKFSEILNSSLTEVNNAEIEKHNNQPPKHVLSSSKNENYMFSSASGKNIQVSEDSLAKVKSKFNEILNSSITEVNNSGTETHIKLLPSFGKNENYKLSNDIKKSLEVSDVGFANFIEITEGHEDKSGTNIDQAPKALSPSCSNSGNFVFSSATGKNVNVSESALAKIKFKFNENSTSQLKDETDNPENHTDNNQAHKTFLPSSSVSKHFMFSSASGKNINVSEDCLAKVKSKFSDIFDNSLTDEKKSETVTNINPVSKSLLTNSNKADNFLYSTATSNNIALIKGETNEVEKNECHLLETSFSCFDKADSFNFPIDDSRNIEISDVLLEPKESKSDGILKDNPTKVDLSKLKNIFELSKSSLSMNNKKDNSFPFSADLSANVNVIDKLIHQNNSESFPSCSKMNVIESETTPDKYQGIKFSTARGKHISVSENALAKVRSKFSEVTDDISMFQFQAEKTNDCTFQLPNSSIKNLSNDECLNTVLGKNESNEIIDCLAPYPMLINQTPTNSLIFSKVNRDKKLSINADQNDKKSKSSHTEDSTLDQPSSKKLCSQPGIVSLTPKRSYDVRDHNISETSKTSQLTFTQSISQSLLDEEIDIIEKKKFPKEIFSLNGNELNTDLDGCLKTKDLESNKCDSQFSTEESDLTMIYEVSDSAAAFIADCTPDRSVLSSPSSFFNRKSMKPIKLLDMEFDDVDDEIMVAAELKVAPEPTVQNLVSNNLTNNSQDKKKFKTCSAEVLLIRSDQRKRIDEIINKKLKNRPLASPGLYMTLRKEGILKRFCDHLQPFLDKEQLGLEEETLYINSTNAEMYEFSAESFFSYEQCFSAQGIIDLGYGFSLILSDDNKIGLSELSRCFLSNPNVDPSMVSSDWLKNHFKWIVWKLASYDRAFLKDLSMRYLTPENVLHQLKYRYDREIDLVQRPALKKILECDEPSSRRLIACVANIRNVDLSDNESSYEIELTDGWYSIWACIDPAMKNLIDRQKVKIGTKLIIHAAELLNCTEGCDPLQIDTSVRLKLHTNCARRVKWHTKMGFTRHPGPIRVPLSSIFHNGGFVGLTSAIIARVYPLLYMSKDAAGKTVLRNAYAENYVSSLKENDLTLKSEQLFEKLYPEVESKYKSGVVKFDKNNIKKIKEPELLWKIVSNESDPSEVQSLMTPDQLFDVQKYHEVISSKMREEVQALVKKKLEELIPSHKAKCLLKLRLVDPVGGCNALLTVWNPSEDLLQILVEKKCFDFYGLSASGIRDKVLQLSSTKRTIYKESNLLKPSEEFGRKVTAICDIVDNSISAQFGEIDIVGMVVFVKEPEKPWGVTNVYLSDNQDNFLMITFWTSLKTLGCDETLKPGSAIACINLQWRQGSGSYVIPSTYANEMTYFSTHPNQEYLIKALQEIKSSISTKGVENFIIERRRRLFTILKEREYNTKAPISRVDTPRVLKRLENLKKYGEASPLPKLSLLSSPDIHRNFRSPKSGSS